MAIVYEDNFGFWDIDDPGERAFFEHVQRQSALAKCERCKRPARLMSCKTLCASCVAALECGAPASIDDYDQAQPTILDPRRPSRRPLRSRVRQLCAGRGHRGNEPEAIKRSSSL
jgi:hypothetical protein